MLDNYEIIKFLASFTLLVIILYAIYYYVSNFQPKFKSGGKEIEVLETKVLGKNRFLYLIKVKDTTMLIAHDEQGMKLIKEWKDA
ncbi:flagellar biosynthetic protein FliO [Nitratiruptor sp. YY09-18]|uniref:flagellar biosynthetic protein FliO n=1 Tax=Nitratiruptor sp. YY09-18 TaxID=2724901 RepID=UPI001916C188|nr:flagellar biosynthetic protein FliO [Nitratiruptor sp. YY09-18]BCD68379.1 flagellar protein FliO/FliZ [Nitratiruptor sp. YY09-18]